MPFLHPPPKSLILSFEKEILRDVLFKGWGMALAGGRRHRGKTEARSFASRVRLMLAVLCSIAMCFLPFAAQAENGQASRVSPQAGTSQQANTPSDDASNSGVKIGLYDYSRPDINNSHAMKFGNNYMQTTWWGMSLAYCGNNHSDWNCWTGSGMGAHANIVQRTLWNGYPSLNQSVAGSTDSLDYLFGGASDTSVTDYTVDGGLLYKDSDGYYTFDSSKQYARYDSSTHRFDLSDNPRLGNSETPQFTPFNNRSDTSYDYSFGMSVTSSFYMPEDGKINGQDMVFDFSGDDDVWVFLDDVLVLDLGGIHDEASGKIDFASGNITYGSAAVYGGTPATSLSDAFKNAGKTWDSTEYKSHTLKMFYMERGDGGSNCRLRFNMPSIPEGTVEIGKKVDYSNVNDVSDIDFRFNAYVNYAGDDKNYELFKGQYDVLDASNTVIDTRTANDGLITLKDGQTARLKSSGSKIVKRNSKYYVTELGATSDKYIVTVPGTKVSEDSGESLSKGASTDHLSVDDYPHIVFHNAVNVNNAFNLKVAKQCQTCVADSEFHVRVKVGDKPYTGQYDLYNANNEKVTTKPLRSDNGIIALKPGQYAMIIGLVGGNRVTVTEVDKDGSLFSDNQFRAPEYVMVASSGTPLQQDPIKLSDGGGITGVVNEGKALGTSPLVEATVTNLPKSVEISQFLPLRKTVQTNSGGLGWQDGSTFTFQLEQVDEVGGRYSPVYGAAATLPKQCATATAKKPCTVSLSKPSSGNRADSDFGTIDFSKPGTYRYMVTERQPKSTDRAVTTYHYSQAKYLAVVTVTSPADSNDLQASTKVTRIMDDSGANTSDDVAVDKLPMTFTNTNISASSLPLTGDVSDKPFHIAAWAFLGMALAGVAVYVRFQNKEGNNS